MAILTKRLGKTNARFGRMKSSWSLVATTLVLVVSAAASLAFQAGTTARPRGVQTSTASQGWVSVGTMVRGDIMCAVYANASVAFAGSASGVLHRSTDGGQTWWPTALDADVTGGAAILAVAPSPTFDTDGVVLVGTGAGVIFRNAASGTGGVWTQVLSLPGIPITKLFAASGLLVWAGTNGDGLYTSTDLGLTFTKVLPAMPGSGKITELDQEAAGPVWACTDYTNPAAGDAGVLGWDGTRWIQVTAPPPAAGPYRFRSILIQPLSGGDLWVGDQTNGLFAIANPGGGASASWSLKCSIPWVQALGVAPDGTGSQRYAGSSKGLHTISMFGCAPMLPRGLAIHGIAFRPGTWGPTDPHEILLATSNGLRLKTEGAFPYEPPLYATGFDISTLAASPNFATDYHIFAASRSAGTFLSVRSPDGSQGPVFRRVIRPAFTIGGSGEADISPVTGVALSPVFDGRYSGCGLPETTLFLSTDGDGVFYSDDGGGSLAGINGGLPDMRISSLALSPAYPADPTLFAGCSALPSVYRRNLTGGWATLSPFPTGTTTPTRITCLGLPPNYNGITNQSVFAGTDTGLYRSDDNGSTWSGDLQGLPTGGEITALVFRFPANGVMFAAVNGYGVYKSLNGGTVWTQIANFSSQPLRSLALSSNFASDQTMALGLDAPGTQTGGVYESTDGGQTWAWLYMGGSNKIKALTYAPASAGAQWLFQGTASEQVYYTGPSTSSWQAAAGFGTASRLVRATATGPSPEQADVFSAGDEGVLWSSDGGETFVPLNQGFGLGTSCIPQVNCLFSFMAGTIGPIPRLLAGTTNQGIWSLDAAFNADGSLDWSANRWNCRLAGGTINHFSRDRSVTPFSIRAGGDRGVGGYAWTSPDGIDWTRADGGLPGPLTDVRHGVMATPVVAGHKVPGEAVSGPKAPSGSSVWGTVLNSGAYHGTDSGAVASRAETVTWEVRNGNGVGSLPDLNGQAILQLSDESVLYGTQATGIYRSADKGLSFWEPSSSGLESTSQDIRDFIEASNGDVLCAVNGPSGNGGVFLSGDRGKHWVSISDGFDASDKSLSSVVSDESDPPTYYAGTSSSGPYARTIQALAYPTVTSLDISTGGSVGGDTITVTGTNFLGACPSGYSCLNGSAVVTFGGIDAPTAYIDANTLSAITPAHPAGTVDVGVRNPDSRGAFLAGAFLYTESLGGPSISMGRDLSGNVVVSWTGATGGSVGLYRSPRPDFSAQVKMDVGTGVSGSFTYSDPPSTNGYLYFFKAQ